MKGYLLQLLCAKMMLLAELVHFCTIAASLKSSCQFEHEYHKNLCIWHRKAHLTSLLCGHLTAVFLFLENDAACRTTPFLKYCCISAICSCHFYQEYHKNICIWHRKAHLTSLLCGHPYWSCWVFEFFFSDGANIFLFFPRTLHTVSYTHLTLPTMVQV